MNVIVRITLTLVIAASLCTACQQSATPSPTSPTPQLDPDIEEYAVYAAILEGTFVREDTKQVLIMGFCLIFHILRRTIMAEFWSYM